MLRSLNAWKVHGWCGHAKLLCDDGGVFENKIKIKHSAIKQATRVDLQTYSQQHNTNVIHKHKSIIQHIYLNDRPISAFGFLTENGKKKQIIKISLNPEL
ncbi:hypothetical protein VNO77_42688 [Canavalia gladiata]|uniref:Uncharacterized protein n=1 Tax=Canavalia gladiata TaxID=3824 RepID=A0AAN9JUZ7_CANGL